MIKCVLEALLTLAVLNRFHLGISLNRERNLLMINRAALVPNKMASDKIKKCIAQIILFSDIKL